MRSVPGIRPILVLLFGLLHDACLPTESTEPDAPAQCSSSAPLKCITTLSTDGYVCCSTTFIPVGSGGGNGTESVGYLLHFRNQGERFSGCYASFDAARRTADRNPTLYDSTVIRCAR